MSNPSDLGQVLGRLNPPAAFQRLPRDLVRPDLDPRVIPEPIEPPPVPDPQPEPEPGSFSGDFSGETALIVVDPPAQPGLPGSSPQLREVGSRNLKHDLLEVWNDWLQPLAPRQFEDAIESICDKDLPGAVRRLYDAQVELSRGDAGADTLNLSVSPAHRNVHLFYLIGAEHRMQFKADVKVFSDPRVTVNFHLAMTLAFATGEKPAPHRPPVTSKCHEGPPPGVEPVNVNGSIWLRMAGVRLMNPRVSVSKKLDLKIIDFVRVGTFAQSIERNLAGSSADLMAASPILVRGLRDALRDVQQQGSSTDNATPWYDKESHRLELQLRQPSPFDVRPTDILSH
jgi:hypothetical protein